MNRSKHAAPLKKDIASCDPQEKPNYAGFAIALRKVIEYLRDKDVDVGEIFPWLAAFGAILSTIVAVVKGLVLIGVIVVAILVIIGLLIGIGGRIARWNKRRLAKKRYGTFNKFVTTASQIMKNRVRLDSLLVTSAKMKGGSIIGDGDAGIYLSRRSQTMLDFQLQAKQDDYLKSVHVILEQVGESVIVRADWAARASPDTPIGYDFASDPQGCVTRVPLAINDTETGYGVVDLHFRTFSRLRPLGMPAVIYCAGLRSKWHPFPDVPHHIKIAEFCLPGSVTAQKIEQDASGVKSCVIWRENVKNWGERFGGVNIKKANVLVVRARGESGGENVSFFMGGVKNHMVPDTADRREIDVRLKKKWRNYRIPLFGLDLTRIKTPFGLRTNGHDAPIVFYIAKVVYAHSWWLATSHFISRLLVACSERCRGGSRRYRR